MDLKTFENSLIPLNSRSCFLSWFLYQNDNDLQRTKYSIMIKKSNKALEEIFEKFKLTGDLYYWYSYGNLISSNPGPDDPVNGDSIRIDISKLRNDLIDEVLDGRVGNS